MTIILGIDPSLTSTGWAILEVKNTNNFRYIESGTIKTLSKETFNTRLLIISNAIHNIIKSYNPKHIGLEQTFVNSNSSTSLQLGMVRGAILITCLQSSRLNNGHVESVNEISPTNMKKLICNNGHADKESIEKMLNILLPELHGKVFKSSDETDAIGISMAVCLSNLSIN